MTMLTLPKAKEHLLVGHDRDDVLIQGYLEAATAHAERYLRRDFAVDYVEGIPAPVEVAILQHVHAMFYNRGAVDDAAHLQPLGYSDLMASYRSFQ